MKHPTLKSIMLTIQGRPYILIVSDGKNTARASDTPLCMGSDHARAVLDQIVQQMKAQRKKMKLDGDFAVLLRQVPTE